MQPGPSDVPAPCAKCGQTTLHRPATDGQLHCLRCLMVPASSQQHYAPQQHYPPPPPQHMAPQTFQALQAHVMPPPQQPQVIQVQQKAGGGVIRGTIDFAKFIFALLFLLSVGTCVYVCGSVGKDSKSHSSSRP